MEFKSSSFLTGHIQSILNFYDPVVIDPTGGYFQNFFDNGTVFDPAFRQLVSSTRIIVNYATAAKFFAREDYLDTARHGLEYLEKVHWQEKSQSYAWTLRNHKPVDMTQQAYGYAFILLAYSSCLRAGLIESSDPIMKIYNLLEQRFWLRNLCKSPHNSVKSTHPMLT